MLWEGMCKCWVAEMAGDLPSGLGTSGATQGEQNRVWQPGSIPPPWPGAGQAWGHQGSPSPGHQAPSWR